MDSVCALVYFFLTPSGHWAFQATEQFYNGVTKDDIEGPNKNLRNGIDRKNSSTVRC
jgi:hypothetical protein